MEQLHPPMAKHHIQESGSVLALRMILAIFLADVLYLVVGIILFGNVLPVGVGMRVSLITALTCIKILFQSIFIVAIIVKKSSNNYYITDKQLIIHRGVVERDEKVYDIEHIRAVKRHESWLGKLLGYGDITVYIAESTFREDVVLNNIVKPKKYEQVFTQIMRKSTSD